MNISASEMVFQCNTFIFFRFAAANRTNSVKSKSDPEQLRRRSAPLRSSAKSRPLTCPRDYYWVSLPYQWSFIDAFRGHFDVFWGVFYLILEMDAIVQRRPAARNPDASRKFWRPDGSSRGVHPSRVRFGQLRLQFM